MGFCKCRRRTELWNTKSEVPVCLDCITHEEHENATIMKYADWLENPVDPLPVCPLCSKELSADDEKIRFMNLQLYSLEAIDEYGKNLPPNTALAGFVIPNTNEPMLPAVDDNSKLAQQIRTKLRRFSWIAPLMDAQLTGSLSQPELIPQAPLGTLASRKVKTENSHSTLHQSQGNEDVSINIEGNAGDAIHKKSRVDADDDKYRRRPLANVLTLCGINIGPAGYSLNSRRLCILIALFFTLSTVFILSMGIDEDLRSQIEDELMNHIQKTANRLQGKTKINKSDPNTKTPTKTKDKPIRPASTSSGAKGTKKGDEQPQPPTKNSEEQPQTPTKNSDEQPQPPTKSSNEQPEPPTTATEPNPQPPTHKDDKPSTVEELKGHKPGAKLLNKKKD